VPNSALQPGRERLLTKECANRRLRPAGAWSIMAHMNSEHPEQSSGATIVVHGEAVAPTDKHEPPRKELSPANVAMQNQLPGLIDDAKIGVESAYVITRDGKADLSFVGTLLASAAPESAPQGQWSEYRVYTTNGGKYVFSKITRHVNADQPDQHDAEVFDPAPASMPAKLLRSAHDLTHTQHLTWTDAAVKFFGFDPLAKILYRKFGGQFEERIG